MENKFFQAGEHLSVRFRQNRILRIFIFPWFLLLIVISATGCVTLNDPQLSQENYSDSVAIINSHTSLTQSITIHRPNLNSITIWLTQPSDQDSQQTSDGTESLNVKLLPGSIDSTPVYSSTIYVTLNNSTTPYTIQVPALDRAVGDHLYLQLSTSSGIVEINGRNGDAYPDGEAFLNLQPIDADIAFRTGYEYDFRSFIQDVGQGIRSIWLVFPLLLVTWLPGWLLLDLSGVRYRFDFGEQCGLSIGISLALTPIIMLWSSILKLHWSMISTFWITGLLTCLFIVVRVYKFLNSQKVKKTNELLAIRNRFSLRQINKPLISQSLALMVILIATFCLRMIMVRDLSTPAWVDSVHHALLTRLILLNGGFPSTLFPYVNISPSTYHMGFHSVVALFTWLSNLSIEKSLLLFGQAINAGVVFSVYLLAKNVTKSTPAGLVAALITGFLTPMPAYYASWGRYTELAGLVILPAAFVLIRSLKQDLFSRQRNWFIGLSAVTSAGLFMVHYRVIVFLFSLIIAYLIVSVLFNNSISGGRKMSMVFKVFLVSLISMALVTPWLFQTIKSSVLPFLKQIDSNPSPYFQDFSWAYLTSALGKYTLVLCGLGIAWAILNKKRFPYVLIIWTALLFLIANLGALKLPGGGLITSSSVEIMLFLPISILGGYFLDQVQQSWKKLANGRLPILLNGLWIVGFTWVALLGSKQLANIINPITILSRAADLPAIEWVNQNIAENETIVINPFAWGYGIYAGGDGGYWVSPLSGRATLPPPVLYGLSPDANAINAQCQKLIEYASDPLHLHEFMQDNQLRYIFLGAKGGIFSPEMLISSGYFSTLYHEDGVWILMLTP